MTEPSVEVTQADREAAEALALTLFDGDYDPQSIARTFTQAFARHRIAAQSEAAARVTVLRGALLAVRDDLHNENRLNTHSISDTIWHGPAETTADFIDAVLADHPQLPFALHTDGAGS